MTPERLAKVAEDLRIIMATHCGHCLRPQASEADWENTEEGERPDLCWEDPGNCRFGAELEPAEFYAAALADRLDTFRAEDEARALREAAGDPALRLAGHSGVSVKGLRDRADRIGGDA